MIKSTMVMGLSSHRQDVTLPASVEESPNHCTPVHSPHGLIIRRPFSYPLAHLSQQDRVLIEEGQIIKWHATPTDPWGPRDLAKEIAAVGRVRFDVILRGVLLARHLHQMRICCSRRQIQPEHLRRGVMTANRGTALRQNGLNVSGKADRKGIRPF